MPFVTADDGAQIFYKDWGAARPSSSATAGRSTPMPGMPGLPRRARSPGHRPRPPWPRSLHPDLARQRDGHLRRRPRHPHRGPRPDRPHPGRALDGWGEIVHYVGRHGSARVAKLVLVSAVPPLMLQTDDNPEGLPIAVFDEIRAGEAADRSQLYRDLADGPFFGHNRNQTSTRAPRRLLAAGDGVWSPCAYECIAAFSATDFRRTGQGRRPHPGHPRRRRPDRPVRGRREAVRRAHRCAVLKVYECSGHALPDTDRDRLHADLLEFINS